MKEAENSAKTLIVTGAGTNLGRAMALRLLRDGFRCVLAGRDEALIAETVELSDAQTDQATIFACNLQVPEERHRLLEVAIAQPGRLFGLINNAAIFRFRPFFDETLEDWRETLETNLEAVYFLSQLAIEVMRRSAGGRIVNIASMHGMVGVSHLGRGATLPEATPGDRGPVRCSAYAISKGGVIQLTRELAIVAGRWGITVNSVSPGTIYSANGPPQTANGLRGSAWMPDADKEQVRTTLGALAGQTLLGRLGTVEEVAGPVRFLLSEDASYITGTNLVVDGGFTAW
jgi:NAD(P)-dependent dehydrogenase (short-subunit alcohol dehydrogenase family)